MLSWLDELAPACPVGTVWEQLALAVPAALAGCCPWCWPPLPCLCCQFSCAPIVLASAPAASPLPPPHPLSLYCLPSVLPPLYFYPWPFFCHITPCLEVCRFSFNPSVACISLLEQQRWKQQTHSTCEEAASLRGGGQPPTMFMPR